VNRDWLKLAAIATAWLAGGLSIANHLAPHLPAAIRQALTVSSYYAAVWVTTTAIGVGLSFALLERPRDDLGLSRPSASAVVLALLIAPAVLALGLYLAWKLALPTITQELAERGKQAVRASVSSANRATRQDDIGTIVVWTVLVTPLAEELIVRGAIWSTITRLTKPWAEPGARSLPSTLMQPSIASKAFSGARRGLMSGGLATLLTAGLFAWLHLESAGGAAILALTQTACLGLALGTLRHASGTIVPGIAMHALFNGLTLAMKRGVIPNKPFWPLPLPIPWALWQIAGIAAAVAIVVAVHRSRRLTTASARARIWIQRARSDVFDFVIAPQTIVKSWRGHGPIPATEHVDMDGPMRAGALRTVTNSDGSIIEERIVALERPLVQEYRLERGFRFPFTALVRGAGGRWDFSDEDGGTRVSWQFHFDLTTPLVWPVVPFFRRPFERAMQEALERQRDILEAGNENEP
jgi:membrane protease YdiL (CAAX protease family)